jgi:hypothetical protein
VYDRGSVFLGPSASGHLGPGAGVVLREVAPGQTLPFASLDFLVRVNRYVIARQEQRLACGDFNGVGAPESFAVAPRHAAFTPGSTASDIVRDLEKRREHARLLQRLSALMT